MYTAPNLGLTIWETNDDFNHDQLALNWLAIDTHNHTVGSGVQIPSGGIQDGAISAAKLASASVSSAALQALAVATGNLQDASVTTPKIAPGAITGNAIPTGGIAITKLDPTILPLGFTALWWAPPGSGAVPGGVWEAMDGRPWSTITNAWGLATGNIPDTRGLFVKGASLTGTPSPAIAATGGSASANLAHTHGVLGHTHSVPGHAHGIFSDGAHFHLWSGSHLATRTNAFARGLTIYDINSSQRQNSAQSLYIQNVAAGDSDLIVNMDTTGAHNHTGVTDVSSALTTGSATGGTDSQLGSTAIDPPWVGLVYIMRVR